MKKEDKEFLLEMQKHPEIVGSSDVIKIISIANDLELENTRLRTKRDVKLEKERNKANTHYYERRNILAGISSVVITFIIIFSYWLLFVPPSVTPDQRIQADLNKCQAKIKHLKEILNNEQ